MGWKSRGAWAAGGRRVHMPSPAADKTRREKHARAEHERATASARSTSAQPQPRGRPSVQPMAAQGAPQRAADGSPRGGPSCACVDGGAQGAASGPCARDRPGRCF